MAVMPNVPMVAVFDTAWGQTMPKKAFMYALPYDTYEKFKVRRYGFHGTSHRYVAGRAIAKLDMPQGADARHHVPPGQRLQPERGPRR